MWVVRESDIAATVRLRGSEEHLVTSLEFD
jgi:hypothetical protein